MKYSEVLKKCHGRLRWCSQRHFQCQSRSNRFNGIFRIFGIIAVFFLGRRALCLDPALSVQISLREALVRIGEVSPLVRESNLLVKEADASIGVSQASRLPQISAQAFWSHGSPGVFAVTGVDANYGTFDRSGAGLGIDLKQDIYDFGKSGHEIAAEEARKVTQQTTLDTEKSRAQLELLHVYVRCAYLTSSLATAQKIEAMSKMVARETDRFVKSGQRSIIERYLLDSQTKVAETRVAETKVKLEVIEKRLTALLQLQPSSNQSKQSTPVCENLVTLFNDARTMSPSTSINSLLRVEEARLRQFDELQKSAHADLLPRFVLEAQGGYFNAEHLNPDGQNRQNFNYGIAVGITMPLYTGHRIESKIGEAQAQYEHQRAVVARTIEKIQQENFSYDEQIQSLDVRLVYLEKENELANKVFELAKNRYDNFQGTMIDVRDSLREQMRVLDDRDQALSQIAQLMVQRSLWNEAYSR